MQNNDFSEIKNNWDDKNVKKHYIATRGEPVPKDFFYFNCYEEEKNMKALEFEGDSKSKIAGWPGLEQVVSTQDLWETLDQLVTWYATEYTVLSSVKVLDYEKFSEFVYPFVRMHIDIVATVEVLTQKRLPKYEVGETEFWDKFDELIKKHFSTVTEFITGYYKWLNLAKKMEELNLASLPPVGRFIPILRKSSHATASYEPRSRPADRPAKFGNKPNFKDDRPRNKPFPPKNSEDSEINEAMNEAKNAMQKIERGELLEVTLLPRNSFLRRKQHQLVSDAGFISESTGDGEDRRILIKKQV